MNKIMKIPFYIPFIGILLSFALLLTAAEYPNSALIISGLIILFLSAWILGITFFMIAFGSFGTVLNK
jgi:hypothetical protein